MNIWCLMTSGGPMTDSLREYLFFLARQMMREKKERFELKEEEFAIGVETKFASALLGTTGGIVFWATVEVGPHTIRARYIVRHSDLEAGDPDPNLEAWEPSDLSVEPN